MHHIYVKRSDIVTVLFSDNVGFQQAQAFHVPCRQMITVVYLLPDNHTDKIQPVDAGFERIMKEKIGEAIQTMYG